MANIFAGQIYSSAPTSVTIGNTSTSVIGANSDRVGLILTNVSNVDMSLALDGNTAVLYNGIFLSGGGGAWSMDDYTFTKGAINAIASGAGGTLSIQEFYTKF